MGAISFPLISVVVVSITLALELGSKTSSSNDCSRTLSNTVDNSKAGASGTSTLESGEGATSYDTANTTLDTSGS